MTLKWRHSMLIDTPTLVPHVHAEVIKAWAEGNKIEIQRGTEWGSSPAPTWSTVYKYRVKPLPDIKHYRRIELSEASWGSAYMIWHSPKGGGEPSNVEVTFDGNTGALKSIEILPIDN